MPASALKHRAPAVSPPLPGGAHLWSKRLRTAAPFHLAAHTAAVDGAGNLLIAGRFGDHLDLTDLGGPNLRGDPGQVFVLQLDPRGALRWAQRIGGAYGDRPAWAVATDREGACFLAGETHDGSFLLKLDATGKHRWTRRLSGIVSPARDRQPLSVATDGAGNVWVLGHGSPGAPESTSGPPSSGTSLAYLFLLRFDPTGCLLWSRRFGCAGRAQRPRLLVDARRNAIVSGYFQGTLTFGSNVLRTPPAWDLYLAKLDPDGDPVWSKRFAGKDTSGFGAGVDAAGNVIVGGAFLREIDVGLGPLRSEGGTRALFLAKLDPAGGRPLWMRRYPGDTQSAFELSLAVEGGGSAIFAGCFEGSIDLGGMTLRSARENESIFIAHLDPDGGRAWGRAFKGPREQTGISVHAAPGGDVLVLGSFGGSVSLGGEPLWDAGQPLDLFVTRLAGGDAS